MGIILSALTGALILMMCQYRSTATFSVFIQPIFLSMILGNILGTFCLRSFLLLLSTMLNQKLLLELIDGSCTVFGLRNNFQISIFCISAFGIRKHLLCTIFIHFLAWTKAPKCLFNSGNGLFKKWIDKQVGFLIGCSVSMHNSISLLICKVWSS